MAERGSEPAGTVQANLSFYDLAQLLQDLAVCPAQLHPVKEALEEQCHLNYFPGCHSSLENFGMQLPGVGIMTTLALSYSKHFAFVTLSQCVRVKARRKTTKVLFCKKNLWCPLVIEYVLSTECMYLKSRTIFSEESSSTLKIVSHLSQLIEQSISRISLFSCNPLCCMTFSLDYSRTII